MCHCSNAVHHGPPVQPSRPHEWWIPRVTDPSALGVLCPDTAERINAVSWRACRRVTSNAVGRGRAAVPGRQAWTLSAILDAFVAVTGYERKYAIRLLLGPIRPREPLRRPRAAHYGVEVQQALTTACQATRSAASGSPGALAVCQRSLPGRPRSRWGELRGWPSYRT